MFWPWLLSPTAQIHGSGSGALLEKPVIAFVMKICYINIGYSFYPNMCYKTADCTCCTCCTCDISCITGTTNCVWRGACCNLKGGMGCCKGCCNNCLGATCKVLCCHALTCFLKAWEGTPRPLSVEARAEGDQTFTSPLVCVFVFVLCFALMAHFGL